MKMTKSGKIKISQLPWLPETDNNLHYKQLISAEEHGPDISVTLIEIDGDHHELKTNASTRIYSLISGEFSFVINDEESFDATAGDLIYIERGDRYRFSGHGQYLVINGPAFQSGDDIYTDGVAR